MTNKQVDVLEAQGIRLRYGAAVALDDVSITVPAGAVTAVVGPNGAGKSSLVGAIYGSRPAHGAVSFAGKSLNGLPAFRRARGGLGLVPQGRQLFPTLTVVDNLKVMADLLELSSERVDDALDRFPILRSRSSALAGWLSGGEQQMLAVSRALMARPSVLMLDEVSTGLAPLIVEQIASLVRSLAREGTAVLVVAPELGALERIVDRGYVLVRGRRVAATENGGAALQVAYREAMHGPTPETGRS